MPPSDRQIQDRLGNALFRLTTIERRAGGAESPKAAARLMDDLRKLAAELERSFEDVREVLAECSRLQAAASAAAERARMLFDLNPVPCLVLEMTGAIVEANEPAVRLLNVSRRHLVGRSFHLYLGNEREVFLKRIQALPATADRDRWTAKLRPRERSSVEATLTAAHDPDGRVLMMLQPASEAFDGKWRAPLTDVEADDRTLAGH